MRGMGEGGEGLKRPGGTVAALGSGPLLAGHVTVRTGAPGAGIMDPRIPWLGPWIGLSGPSFIQKSRNTVGPAPLPRGYPPEPQRAPLEPLPVTYHHFQCIVTEIVGHLP